MHSAVRTFASQLNRLSEVIKQRTVNQIRLELNSAKVLGKGEDGRLPTYLFSIYLSICLNLLLIFLFCIYIFERKAVYKAGFDEVDLRFILILTFLIYTYIY